MGHARSGLIALLLTAGFAANGCGGAAATPTPAATPVATPTPAATSSPAPSPTGSALPGSASQPAGPTATVVRAATTAPASFTPAAPAASLPAGPIRFVALGDSLTEGQGDDTGTGGYPGRLLGFVNLLRPGSTMLNLGHSGWSSQDMIDGSNGQGPELDAAVAARANVALVWVGSNDLWYLYEFGPEPMTPDAEQADLAEFESNVDTIVAGLTKSGAVVCIALLDDQTRRAVVANPPNPSELAFPATTAADLALMSAHVAAYNDIIRRKASQYGARTVDFSRSKTFTDPALMSGDGNHPNGAGYDQVADAWFKAIEPLLR
jgi:lysophospholipase L1-like esterase